MNSIYGVGKQKVVFILLLLALVIYMVSLSMFAINSIKELPSDLSIENHSAHPIHIAPLDAKDLTLSDGATKDETQAMDASTESESESGNGNDAHAPLDVSLEIASTNVDHLLEDTEIKPSQLAIVTYYAAQKNLSLMANQVNKFSNKEYSKVANATMTNLARYAQLHGHAFFFMNEHLVDTEKQAAYWGKMDVIEYYMDMGYEWILYTDIDVLFMNFERSISEEWIKGAKKSTHLLLVDECLQYKKKKAPGPIRSGFFAIRNSKESREFLHHWAQTFSSYKTRPDPEQHALEDIIKKEPWSNISEIASYSKIHTYPECYDGSALSVHFAGTRKPKVAEYLRLVKNAPTVESDFFISSPWNPNP